MKRGSRVNRYSDRYLGIPILFAASLLHRAKPRPQSLGRIGVLVSPTLGDTILNSVVVQDIRSHYHDSKIVYFSTPTNAAAVSLIPGIDEVVDIVLTQPLETIKTIRRCKLDALLDFTPWQRLTAFYTAVSGAKYRVGFRTKNQHRHWLYDLTVAHSAAVHEVDNFRALLRAIGIVPTAQPKLIDIPVQRLDSTGCERVVVFHPWATGDSYALREWHTEKWTQLALELQSSNTTVFVTGGPAQLRNSQALVGRLTEAGVRSRVFVGNRSLQDLCVLLKEAALVVSVNTGVMHLAAVIGAPTIALNGPTSTNRWGPVGQRAASVEPRGGGGFLNLGFEFQGNPTDCMDRIEVEDVVAAIRQLAPDLLTTEVRAPGPSISAPQRGEANPKPTATHEVPRGDGDNTGSLPATA